MTLSICDVPVVINAGGNGTRLRQVNGNLPKALTPIFDEPIIDNQIQKLISYGFSSFHFMLGHNAEIIKEHIIKKWSDKIDCHFHIELHALGSGGSLLLHCAELPEKFLFIYCDIFFDVDFKKMLDFHNSENADVTLFAHPNNHPQDSDIVEITYSNRVTAIHSHPHEMKNFSGNLVNAAIYIVDKKVLDVFKGKIKKLDFAQEMLPKFIQKYKVSGYKSPEFAKDMGTPNRLLEIQSSYRYRYKKNKKNPVIYLDRDGTINKIKTSEYITSPNQIELLDQAASAIEIIRSKGYFVVIVTNQPILARGDITNDELSAIHNRLEYLLGVNSAYVDQIYHCPHHPDRGFSGEVASLKFKCDCRKPGVGLFELSESYIRADKSRSWMVGDSQVDIAAGKQYGLKTCILSNTLDHSADLNVVSIYNFANRLVEVE